LPESLELTLVLVSLESHLSQIIAGELKFGFSSRNPDFVHTSGPEGKNRFGDPFPAFFVWLDRGHERNILIDAQIRDAERFFSFERLLDHGFENAGSQAQVH
jgi:hypothetical protein